MAARTRTNWPEHDAWDRAVFVIEANLDEWARRLAAEGLPTTKGSTAKLLLLGLTRRAGNDDTCAPARDYLAAMASVSVDAVKKALKSLEAGGLIAREFRNGRKGHLGHEQTTIYRLNWDAIFALPKVKEVVRETRRMRRESGEQDDGGSVQNAPTPRCKTSRPPGAKRTEGSVQNAPSLSITQCAQNIEQRHCAQSASDSMLGALGASDRAIAERLIAAGVTVANAINLVEIRRDGISSADHRLLLKLVGYERRQAESAVMSYSPARIHDVIEWALDRVMKEPRVENLGGLVTDLLEKNSKASQVTPAGRLNLAVKRARKTHFDTRASA